VWWFDTNISKDRVASIFKLEVPIRGFLAVAPCSVVVGYWRFGIKPEDGGSTVHRNVGIQPPHYRAQQPRKPLNLLIHEVTDQAPSICLVRDMTYQLQIRTIVHCNKNIPI
jgi:hypothetical protein